MLTSRGWWFFLILVGVLALALLGNAARPYSAQLPNPSLALVAIAILLWFGWEWLFFIVRVQLVTPKVQIMREVRDDRGPVETLWAGRKFHVRVRVQLPKGFLGLPYVVA